MRSGVLVLQVGFIVAATFLVDRASAQDVPAIVLTERMVMDKALVIERVSGGGGGGGGGGRSTAAIDAVQRIMITGEWKTPKAGDEITLADGSKRAWSEVAAGDDGALPAQSTRGGYALWLVESDEDKIMLLKASGHGMAYVNGEPRAGDPYANGIVTLPVKLHQGVNEILLHCPRGAVKAELTEPRAKWMISDADMTLPDLVQGRNQMLLCSVVIINATDQPAAPRLWVTRWEADQAIQGDADVLSRLPIPPMSVGKLEFRLPIISEKIDPSVAKSPLRIELLQQGTNMKVDRTEVPLTVVGALDLQKRTFISDIDGSVQYFAVRPALVGGPDNGLILTLHGAGVEARGQAAAYKSKDWAHIVAATNRRPFGFDWEDWGRLDALEVLDIAKGDLAHDPQRVYLTGHSMGGHGTWQIGSTFPGEFAAIAPSAGWISFESYGGGRGGRGGAEANPIQQIMRRAGNASRTLELQRNLDGMGVYILHGDKDDNVPVEQARTMKAELEKWHKDLAYHEQPGAGHWWGDECVDWPPLMEFLKAHVKPPATAIDHVVFATASPGVSATRDWATIQQQAKAWDFSRVDVKRDLAKRTITGTTENVARLTLDVSAFDGDGDVSVELDGQRLSARASPHAAEFARADGKWEVAAAPLASSQKTPARCGPFKSAFNHRFMFVYGTKGTAEENAWAFSKARFDAETFWYRGNGSVDIVADVDFNPREAAGKDRSVIIYGNADTNAAWKELLADSPVQIKRGAITLGERTFNGEDLACLLVRPRPGSDVASIGVVSGSGIIGARITDRLSYFVSGVAYPDCIIFDGSGLSRGALGIKAAGFFGNDWTIESGEMAFAVE